MARLKRFLIWTLLVLLGIPLVAAVALLLAGLRDGAGRNEALVDVARPPAALYPFLTDPKALQSWVGWNELQLAEPGLPLRVGSKFKVAVLNDGRRLDLDGEVAELTQDKQIWLILRSKTEPYRFTERARIRLIPVGDSRTRVEMTTRSEYEGLLGLFEPVISVMAQRRLEADVARLKELAER